MGRKIKRSMKPDELFTDLVILALLSPESRSRIILPNSWNIEFLLLEKFDFTMLSWGPVELDPVRHLPMVGAIGFENNTESFELCKLRAIDFIKQILEKPSLKHPNSSE